MGLNKGAKGNNPNGRPIGSKNKGTAELRQRINTFLDDNWETLQQDFESLEPKERLMFYEKLLSFGLPKLQATQLTSDFNSISDEQLDYMIQNLKDG